MKKKICFFIALVFSLKLSCQSLSAVSFKNYDSFSFATYFSRNPNFAFRGDTLFSFNELKLSCFPGNGLPQTYNLETLLPKEDRKLISRDYGFNYLFSGNLLIVRAKNQVFLFNYLNGKPKFRQRIQLSENYPGSIYRKGDSLYFYKIYNQHVKDSKLPSGFILYNLSTGKEEIHKLPFDYLAITHMAPNSFIDFTSSGYLVCDPLRYRIYEYDFEYRLKDSICGPDSSFTISNTGAFKSKFKDKELSENASDYLADMTTYLQTIDRIWMVNYIDENTLFVRLTRNTQNTAENKRELFYDHIWQKKNGSWKLVQVRPLTNFNSSQPITEKDLWPHFFPGSKYTCSNGSLYYTVWSSSANTFPQTGRTFFGFDATDRSRLGLKVIQFKVR